MYDVTIALFTVLAERQVDLRRQCGGGALTSAASRSTATLEGLTLSVISETITKQAEKVACFGDCKISSHGMGNMLETPLKRYRSSTEIVSGDKS